MLLDVGDEEVLKLGGHHGLVGLELRVDLGREADVVAVGHVDARDTDDLVALELPYQLLAQLHRVDAGLETAQDHTLEEPFELFFEILEDAHGVIIWAPVANWERAGAGAAIDTREPRWLFRRTAAAGRRRARLTRAPRAHSRGGRPSTLSSRRNRSQARPVRPRRGPPTSAP